jgi:tripartite-type tricarboxylate transporter receptor subunit TctC
MTIPLPRFFRARLFFVACACAALALPAHGETVADFYKGKRITFIIRAAPGGSYDAYSRLLGRYIVRFIPGNPTVLPVNMPGGGGLVALNHVTNVAPRDGTVLTMITESFPFDQALGTNKFLKVDLRTLNCIGNMDDSSQLLLTSRMSATKTLDDARKRVTIIGASGLGATSTALIALYNNTLGTKFKIIYGYNGGAEVTLAMDRNEVEGRGTSTPQVMAAASTSAPFNALIQTGVEKLKGYESVPLLSELASTPDQTAIFNFVSKAVAIARPVCAGPGVPADRVEALRKAFDATMADAEFQAEAEKLGMEMGPMSGQTLQQLIADLIDTPQDIRDKVKNALTVTSAEMRPGGAAKSTGE